jgi:hypothetical protein
MTRFLQSATIAVLCVTAVEKQVIKFRKPRPPFRQAGIDNKKALATLRPLHKSRQKPLYR